MPSEYQGLIPPFLDCGKQERITECIVTEITRQWIRFCPRPGAVLPPAKAKITLREFTKIGLDE